MWPPEAKIWQEHGQIDMDKYGQIDKLCERFKIDEKEEAVDKEHTGREYFLAPPAGCS
jgi:hypothetical protein